MENKVLDVSIRDSYFYSTTPPSIRDVEVIIDTLERINIRNIEVAYYESKSYSCNSGFFLTGRDETYYNFLNEKFQRNKNLRFYLMIHPEKCTALSEMEQDLNRDFIYGLRILYKEPHAELIKKQISICKRLSKKVYLNVTRITEKNSEYIENAFRFSVDQQVNAFYIADSNSNLLCDGFLDLLKELNQLNTYSSSQKLMLGYHPHDGINMALPNTLLGLKNGIDLVDGSILPYGKFGKRNLNLFFLLIVLLKNNRLPETRNLFTCIKDIDTHFRLNGLNEYIHFLEGITNKNIDDIKSYYNYPRELIYEMLSNEFLASSGSPKEPTGIITPPV